MHSGFLFFKGTLLLVILVDVLLAVEYQFHLAIYHKVNAITAFSLCDYLFAGPVQHLSMTWQMTVVDAWAPTVSFLGYCIA